MACFLRPKVHDVLNCVRATRAVSFLTKMTQVKSRNGIFFYNDHFVWSTVSVLERIRSRSQGSLDPDLGPALITTEVV